jgi:hypothetical protein
VNSGAVIRTQADVNRVLGIEPAPEPVMGPRVDQNPGRIAAQALRDRWTPAE